MSAGPTNRRRSSPWYSGATASAPSPSRSCPDCSRPSTPRSWTASSKRSPSTRGSSPASWRGSRASCAARLGMELARKVREEGATPIIIVTGKHDEADRVMGLEIGADDYVMKPFSPRELLARIRAVLRRYQTAREVLARGDKRRAYRFAGWELNLGSRRLTSPEGRRVDLSNGELNLLQALCAAPQRVLTREQLLDLSRLNGAEVYDRSIDVQILRLRRKIEPNPAQPQYIRTERGAGYVFSLPVQALS